MALRQAEKFRLEETGLNISANIMENISKFCLGRLLAQQIMGEEKALFKQNLSRQTIQAFDEERAYRFGPEEVQQQHRHMIEQARALWLAER